VENVKQGRVSKKAVQGASDRAQRLYSIDPTCATPGLIAFANSRKAVPSLLGPLFMDGCLSGRTINRVDSNHHHQACTWR
jgi:hypothetical protein